jgi:alpha-1,6-mannosyltransferase
LSLTDAGTRRPWATAAVVALSAAAIVSWLILYPWYSLADHYSVQYFAFDKIPEHFNSPILRWTTALFAVISASYVLTYLVLQRLDRISWPIKLILSLSTCAFITINLLLYPVGALDVYNYIIELKLAFLYHQNPYLTTFASYTTDPAGQFAFFNDVRLYYGPAWLYLSALPTLFTGMDDTQRVLLGLKVENLAFLAGTGMALYMCQRDDKAGWIAAYLFVANPLVIFETIGNAHNDIMMAAFLLFAVVALRRGSELAVPLLALSALVKFFSAVLFPLFALDMLRQRWSFRKIVESCLGAAAFVVVFTAPVWAGGQMIQGLAQGVTVAQSLNSASLFSLAREYLRLGPITTEIESAVQLGFLALFALSALLVLVAVWRGRRLDAGLIDTFLLFAVLVSLLTPWYLLPALALIALTGDRAQVAYLLVATFLGLVYYPLSVWAWFDSGMSAFDVHLFQAVFLTIPILGLLGFTLASSLFVSRRSA